MNHKRLRFKDAAFNYRMGAGFPGDVNRAHPFSIEPCLINADNPPTAYGQAVLIDATNSGAEPFGTGDDAVTRMYGVTVRPYPSQQASASNFGAASIGAATPPISGVVDVLREGYITVNVVGTPKKGDPVYIWTAAASGAHVVGGFEAAETSGSTAAIANAWFNNAPDADGNVEIVIRL